MQLQLTVILNAYDKVGVQLLDRRCSVEGEADVVVQGVDTTHSGGMDRDGP